MASVRFLLRNEKKKEREKKNSATAGNRTRANALEGRYPTIGLQTLFPFIFSCVEFQKKKFNSVFIYLFFSICIIHIMLYLTFFLSFIPPHFFTTYSLSQPLPQEQKHLEALLLNLMTMLNFQMAVVAVLNKNRMVLMTTMRSPYHPATKSTTLCLVPSQRSPAVGCTRSLCTSPQTASSCPHQKGLAGGPLGVCSGSRSDLTTPTYNPLRFFSFL